MHILRCHYFTFRNTLNYCSIKKEGVCSQILLNNVFSHRYIASSKKCFLQYNKSNFQKNQLWSSCFKLKAGFNARNGISDAYRFFRTSEPKYIHPALWFVAKPILKLAAILTGRGFRKWWRDLPKDKKSYFVDQVKANKRKIGIGLSLSILISLGYYLSHLEETPITKRMRFMAFSQEQMAEINKFELDQVKETLGAQVLPANHPASRRVCAVVQRIVDSNLDIKEMRNKKFEIAVIESPVENAFVLPIGYVFVFTGMLNLCSNDDQLGIILSHEISHCIQNHGAENVSFVHLLDLISIIIITAIWAVVPSDYISILTHWLYQKSIQVLLQLPYSRKIETEADYVGLQLAAKACFDVRESSAFWSKMSFLNKTFGKVPQIEFLSTHPSHESRSEYLDEIMEDALKIRASCDCPRLSYRDPRTDVEAVSKALEITRKQFFEHNAKPENIFKF